MNIALTESFYLQNCCNCGVAFAVPESFDRKRREDGKSFHCPNGHPQSYTTTEPMRLRKQLEDANRLLEQANNREAVTLARLAAEEKKNRSLAKRLSAGVCPVAGCKRHFTDLKRHVATQHKGVAIPIAEPATRQIAGGGRTA